MYGPRSLLLGMLVGRGGVLVGLLTVMLGCRRVLLGFLMIARAVMMGRLQRVMGGGVMVQGRVVMMFAGGMSRCHGVFPSWENMDDLQRNAQGDLFASWRLHRRLPQQSTNGLLPGTISIIAQNCSCWGIWQRPNVFVESNSACFWDSVHA